MSNKPKPRVSAAGDPSRSIENTAADPSEIDIQVADNAQNSQLEEADDDEYGDYDEEEDEEEYEDAQGEDPQSQPHQQQQKSPQKDPQVAIAQQKREQELRQTKEAQLLKQKAAQRQVEEDRRQQQQQQLQQQKLQAAAGKQAEDQKRAMAQKAINQPGQSRMVSEEDDQFNSRASSMGLIKKQQDDRFDRSGNQAASATGAGSTAAHAPSYAQYRQAAEFFDMSFKFITVLDGMSEIFRITSMLEGLLFFVAIIFFFIGEDRSTWFGVLALCHVARSFIGFGMGRVVPSSYDFVEKLEFKGDRQLEYPQVRPNLTRKVQNLLLEYYDDYERVAKLYFLLAIITFVFDVISFFIVYGLLATHMSDAPEAGAVVDAAIESQIDVINQNLEQINANIADMSSTQTQTQPEETAEETAVLQTIEPLTISASVEEIYLTTGNAYLGRIFVVMLYTICDVVYILWIVHFKSRMGETEAGYVLKALLGFGDGMRVAFGANPKGGLGQAPGNSGANNKANLKNKGGKNGNDRYQ